MPTLSSFLSITLSTLVSTGILVLVIQWLARGKITNYFNSKLESHKHELSLITENAKFDFQRKIHDFNLYRTRKHEIYPELNKQLVKFVESIIEVKPKDNWMDFETATKDQLQRVLNFGNVDEDKIEKHLKNYDQGYIEVAEFKSDIQDVKKDCARKLQSSFKEFYLDSELFLSNEIVKISKPLFTKLDTLLDLLDFYSFVKCYEVPESKLAKKDLDEIATLDDQIKQISNELNLLKEQIKKELSIGDYS